MGPDGCDFAFVALLRCTEAAAAMAPRPPAVAVTTPAGGGNGAISDGASCMQRAVAVVTPRLIDWGDADGFSPPRTHCSPSRRWRAASRPPAVATTARRAPGPGARRRYGSSARRTSALQGVQFFCKTKMELTQAQNHAPPVVVLLDPMY
jgi:hypothetical protein